MIDELNIRVRPIGITLLSIFSLIGGIGMVVLILVAVASFYREDQWSIDASRSLSELGFPLPIIAAGIIFLAALALASGVGMLSGSEWGWYLGSFWYAYAIIRNLNAILVVHLFSEELTQDELDNAAGGPEYQYVRFTIRLVVSILLYMYFFKANVREYFGLAETSRWKAMAIELTIAVLIMVTGTFAAMAME